MPVNVGVQTSYLTVPPIGKAGDLADSWSIEKGQRITLINAGGQTRQTIADVTITYAGAGTYTLTFAGTTPSGVSFSEALALTVAGGSSATAVGDSFVSAIKSNETLNNFLTATNAAGVLTFTVLPYNVDIFSAVTGAKTGSGNDITASPTITASASAGIVKFGYAVGQYSATQVNSNVCSAITTATNLTIAGIAVASFSVENDYPATTSATVNSYAANDAVPVARVGSNIRIFVPVAAAVVAGTVPGVVNTTGQLTTSGSGTALTGARYLTSVAAGGIALVQL